jgi:hypothetical protein
MLYFPIETSVSEDSTSFSSDRNLDYDSAFPVSVSLRRLSMFRDGGADGFGSLEVLTLVIRVGTT